MSAYATTGLQTLGEVPWGSHVCQFFSNGSDLRDTLVPYFKAGLENNERCLLVAMEPFNAENARSALRAAVGDFDRRERRKQIEIHDVRAWYNSDTIINGEEIVAGLWPAKSRRALMATMAFGPRETSAGSAAINGMTSRTTRAVSREACAADA
jgi:MEDS: MEthanogen/methylotroph, DcmR Sensory domain